MPRADGIEYALRNKKIFAADHIKLCRRFKERGHIHTRSRVTYTAGHGRTERNTDRVSVPSPVGLTLSSSIVVVNLLFCHLYFPPVALFLSQGDMNTVKTVV
jgi:hypothetical protein